MLDKFKKYCLWQWEVPVKISGEPLFSDLHSYFSSAIYLNNFRESRTFVKKIKNVYNLIVTKNLENNQKLFFYSYFINKLIRHKLFK